jgi:hypothetical protein
LYPDASETVPDDDLEWAVRLALECRRRVKEQQKRIGTAEFPNTQFSYSTGLDGVEKLVATPELQSEDSIGSDRLSHGQVWAISPGGHDEAVGLYRIEVNEGPGGGVRILNQSPPAPFRESVRIAEHLDHAAALRGRGLLLLAGEIIFADGAADLLEHGERLAFGVQCLAARPRHAPALQRRLDHVGFVILGDRRKAHDLPGLLCQHVADQVVPRVMPEGRLSCSRCMIKTICQI